ESDFRHAQGAIGHGALHHVGNWGRRSRFETWLCPGYPRWEGLYLRLTLSERLRSAWSQPRLSLTGRENRSEPALAGYQHFGGGSDEPLKPYRSYPADLTSGPQRQTSLSDSLGGAERARAWPDHRHGFATSGPQCHWQSRGVVCALPSACSILRYARSDPANGSYKYIPGCKDRPFSAMDGATPHCVHGSLGTSGRGDLPIRDSRWSRPSSEHCSHPRSPRCAGNPDCLVCWAAARGRTCAG